MSQLAGVEQLACAPLRAARAYYFEKARPRLVFMFSLRFSRFVMFALRFSLCSVFPLRFICCQRCAFFFLQNKYQSVRHAGGLSFDLAKH